MRTSVKVSLFLAALGAVFGVAWGVGAAVGPTTPPPPPPMTHTTMTSPIASR
jgi:hypothetical protein